MTAKELRLKRPKRLMWIVNHNTLMRAEPPIFRDLGYEVFIPKILPSNEGAFRSGAVTFEYDRTLTVPSEALAILNRHEFYGEQHRYRAWSPTIIKIINEHFDVVISSLSAFISPLREAVRNFDGLVAARVFGLQQPQRYIDTLNWLEVGDLVDEMAARGSRYAFVQGYSNLAEIEPPGLSANAHTVTVAIPDAFFEYSDRWTGGHNKAIFVCPSILQTGYDRGIYDGIKRDFADIPHVIFGRQIEVIEDETILPFLTEADLISLYALAPVFIYTSAEPRHIHYSPIEAMVVGTPVLYRRGSLADLIMDGADLAGVCATTDEMRAKARRLLQNDRDFADAVRSDQARIVDAFRVDVARRQWADLLTRYSGGPGSPTLSHASEGFRHDR